MRTALAAVALAALLGGCGDAQADVEKAFKGYHAALLARDFPTACSYNTPEATDRLVASLQTQGIDAADCEDAFAAIYAEAGGSEAADGVGNSVQIQGYTIPAIKTRSTNTTIELGDGQSFVLAGLMYSADSSMEDKLPGIGDLPVIGAFFKQTQHSRERQELIIIATPHLVSPMKPGEMPPLPGENLAYSPTIADTVLGTRPLDKFTVEYGLMR